MRTISKVSSEKSVDRTDLDSHADSPVVGQGALILHNTGETVNVIPFTDGLGTCKDVPIVTAAVAYDSNITGDTTILIIHNALYIESMAQNLIPPIMLRINGIEVNECPKFLATNPSETHHSILLPDDLRIPLSLHGSISYLPTRRPTDMECHTKLNVALTCQEPAWNPHCESFASQENSMINHDGSIKTRPPCDRAIYSVMNQLRDDMSLPLHSSNSQTSSVLNEISPTLDTRNLFLKCATHTVSGLSQHNKRNIIDHHRLAKNWKIGPEMAKKTLKVTTQRGIRTMLAPTLDCRFKTNDKMLRYSRLNTNMYTDTMFASKVSLRGNTCGQVYTNDIDFTRFYPMKDRKEMPDTLSNFFREEGVPS